MESKVAGVAAWMYGDHFYYFICLPLLVFCTECKQSEIEMRIVRHTSSRATMKLIPRLLIYSKLHFFVRTMTLGVRIWSSLFFIYYAIESLNKYW